MLSPDPTLFDVCTDIICKEYGPIDLESEIIPWDMTDYYRDEMGAGIVRKFIFLQRLIDPGNLPQIKLFTNRIEKAFAVPVGNTVRRRINLDPGYLTEAKVVLGTTKDYSHRIYIGSNIYAEVTLRYSTRDRRFIAFDYTYPDYRTDAYGKVFNEARELLRTAIHSAVQK